jgi:hypothetical protein
LQNETGLSSADRLHSAQENRSHGTEEERGDHADPLMQQVAAKQGEVDADNAVDPPRLNRDFSTGLRIPFVSPVVRH